MVTRYMGFPTLMLPYDINVLIYSRETETGAQDAAEVPVFV